MKSFCFLHYTNGSMAYPHFFDAEDDEKALKHAKNEWPFAFNPAGKPWWLMEVKSTASASAGGLILSC